MPASASTKVARIGPLTPMPSGVPGMVKAKDTMAQCQEFNPLLRTNAKIRF